MPLPAGPDTIRTRFWADYRRRYPVMAVGTLAEARRLGLRVPDDLSVVGFDDGELRHALVPHLTAVCQDTVGLGRAATEILLDVIERKHRKPRREARRCWFEVHESGAPPSQKPTHMEFR